MTTFRVPIRALLLLCSLLPAACGAPAVNAPDGPTLPADDDAATAAGDASASANDASTSAPDASADDAAPSANDRALTILHGCGETYCHGGDQLDPAQIVGRPSRTLPRMLLVAPGQPDQSFLYVKLAGAFADVPECAASARACGSRMPATGVYLGADDLAAVRSWIAAGAPH